MLLKRTIASILTLGFLASVSMALEIKDLKAGTTLVGYDNYDSQSNCEIEVLDIQKIGKSVFGSPKYSIAIKINQGFYYHKPELKNFIERVELKGSQFSGLKGSFFRQYEGAASIQTSLEIALENSSKRGLSISAQYFLNQISMSTGGTNQSAGPLMMSCSQLVVK